MTEPGAVSDSSVELCANCNRPYDEHLLWDGNKCALGSVAGWFPGKIATAIDPALAPKRPAAYRWGGTGGTLFYLKNEADEMFAELEAAKARWVDRANALERRVRALEMSASKTGESVR